MSIQILDRPALHALRTRHADHATRSGKAYRYDPDVAPFVVMEDDSDQAFADLAGLVLPGRVSILLQADGIAPPPGTVLEMAADGVQMVAGEIAPPEDDLPVIALGEADAQEMVALAALTRPGPFLPRTHLLGGYFGIRHAGRLAAMAGERLQVPGYTEVSAVCTHPDFRGKGYANHLTRLVATRIAARGETPFLHTFAANAAAIRIYERLGFTLRRMMKVTVLRRA